MINVRKLILKFMYILSLTIIFLFISPPLLASATDSMTNNILQNPDFETNSGDKGIADNWERASWLASSENYQMVNTPVSGGQYAQKVAGTTASYLGVSQGARIESNKPFNVNGRFNIENLSNAKIQLYIEFNSNSGYISSYVTEATTTTNGIYITLSSNGTIPANATNVRVYAIMRALSSTGGSAVFNVDSLVFNYDAEPNILSSSDFEKATLNKGVADNWDRASWLASSENFQMVNTPVSGGQYAQKVAGTTASYLGVSQGARVESNKPFNVNGRFNIENLSNAKIQLYIEFNNNSGYISSYVTEAITTTNGIYITLSSNGTIPANATNVRVYAIMRALSSTGGSAVFNVDSLVFNSEPNILSSSDFEKATPNKGVADNWDRASWLASSENYQMVNTPVSGGQYAQKVAGTTASYLGVSQSARVESNKPYNVNGRFNIENLSNAKIQLYVEFNSNSGFISSYVTEASTTTNGIYITLSSNGITPANATNVRVYAIIRALSSAGGSAVFEVDSLVFNNSAPNLLSNSNFEHSTNLTLPNSWYGWSTPGASAVYQNEGRVYNVKNRTSYLYNAANQLESQTTISNETEYITFRKYDKSGNLIKKRSLSGIPVINTVYEGDKAQRIIGSWIPKDGISSIYQTIAVLPNKTYILSGQISIGALYNSKVQMLIEFYDTSWTYISPNIVDVTNVNGQYTNATLTGTIPSNARYATVQFLLKSTNDDGAGKFLVDSANFKYQ